jgi:hypothetical protein
MAQVFMSFIHEEEKYASALQFLIMRILGGEGIPFMSSDKFHIYAGERWIEQIMKELAGTKVVLLMLSPTSVQRPWVNFEAGAAWTRAIIIIPVCFRGLKKDDLPKPYSSLQAVDLRASEDHEYLMRSMAHHLDLEYTANLHPEIAEAIGGPESRKKSEEDVRAYEEFKRELVRLDR